MFKISLAAATISLAGSLLPASVLAFDYPAPGNFAQGAQQWADNCARCHSADGKGAFPGVPDFTDKDGRLSKPDDELFRHVTGGFQSPGSPMAMPPKGGNASLTEQDIQNVIRYLHENFGS